MVAGEIGQAAALPRSPQGELRKGTDCNFQRCLVLLENNFPRFKNTGIHSWGT